MLKRTSSKDTYQLASHIDHLGGEVNAFTDADSLCLHGKVPGSCAEELMDFFAELLLQPAFTESDVETEREVIRQEILESQDSPVDVLYQEFSKAFWPDSVLGSPTFGTVELLESFSYGDLYERLHSLLQGKKMIIVAAGNIDPQKVKSHAEKSFSHLDTGRKPEFVTPASSSGIRLIKRSFTQAHFSLGVLWPSMRDENFLAGVLIGSILGEGMSSRLFQALREERGLVYDVGAEIDMYSDTSCLSISGVVEPNNFKAALDLIVSEVEGLSLRSIQDQELQRVISLHKAQLQMETDSLSTRMWRALESETVFGRHVSCLELSERFSQISLKQIQDVLSEYLEGAKFLLAVAGEVQDFEVGDSIVSLCGDKVTLLE